MDNTRAGENPLYPTLCLVAPVAKSATGKLLVVVLSRSHSSVMTKLQLEKV
jgi:hypothetical protein